MTLPKTHKSSKSNPSRPWRLWLLAAAITVLLLMPVAAADMGEATRGTSIGPGFGTDVTVPNDVAMRHVYGSVQLGTLSNTVSSAVSIIIIQKCTGEDLIEISKGPLVQANQGHIPFSFVMLTGECYEFINSADPASNNAVWLYNVVDVKLESFEGRTYANDTRQGLNDSILGYTRATFCGIGATPNPLPIPGPIAYCPSNEYANATWEGQAHANATWCPLPCASSTDNMTIGNLTIRNVIIGGNFSGNGENITNVTAMTVEGLPPKATNLGFMLSMLLLAGIGVGFVSKTNPLAPFGGMIAEIIGMYLTSGSAATLGSNTQVFIMAFAVALLVLAAKAFFMFRAPGHGENVSLEG